ncbi:MAG: hypothetical protein NPIRA02_33640 [Nitrospirales bacterium]|nr:MAG: hypothetical protein NPIRA02_33640 [Nitrospirales bacterium]
MNAPFVASTGGSSASNGPPVILALDNYSGDISNIPLSSVGTIAPSVSSDLLSAFEDPSNAGTLLAAIRTQNTPTGQATILGGLALQDSTVNASVDVAQFTNANVEIEGTILDLDNSTFTASNDLLNVANSTVDVSASTGLVRVLGGSTLTVDGTVVSANGSQLNVDNGLLDIQDGGTMNVSGNLLMNEGQNVMTAGDTFITVEEGTLTADKFSGRSSDMNLTIDNGGFLALSNNSEVSIVNGFGFVIRNITSDETFVTVDNSVLEMGLPTNGVLARLAESFTVNSGGVLDVNNSGEVSVASIIRGSGTTPSAGTLNGTAVVVNNQSQVTANRVVFLDNLISATDLSLTVNDGGLLDLQNGSAGSFDTVATVAGSSIVTDETLVRVDQSTLAMGSEMLSVTQKGLPSNVTVNNGGVLSLSNGSQYVDAQLLDATSPLVVLVQSTMSTGSHFLDVNSGSTLVASLPNDALVSLDASRLTVNGSLVNVTGVNSAVNVTGAIFSLQNGSVLEIAGGALVETSAGGLFNLTGPLGQFSGGTAANPNILSVTNNVCASSACQAPFAAFPELRVSGPVTVQPGFNPLEGFDPSGNQLNISDDAAVLVNTGGTINLNTN